MGYGSEEAVMGLDDGKLFGGLDMQRSFSKAIRWRGGGGILSPRRAAGWIGLTGCM